MLQQRVGFVGGGNMAAALVRGGLAAGVLSPERVRVSDVREEALAPFGSELGVETTRENHALASWAEVLVLAVKPQSVPGALAELCASLTARTLVISIAAGVPLETLEAALPAGAPCVRVMPNAAAMQRAGAAALALGRYAGPAHLEVARALFEAVGRVVVVEEGLLDAVTGLSGSGPGYVLLVIEALADGGVAMGLPRDAALLLAAQTVAGAAAMVLGTGRHPAVLKDLVTSPGGTTLAGLAALEAGAVRGALMSAVRAATERSAELGRRARRGETG